MRVIPIAIALSALAPSFARAQACTRDDALTRAAEAMLAREAPPSSEELLALVHAAGSDAPAVDALVIRDADPARRERFVERVARRRASPLACGEARDRGRWLVLVAPSAGRIEPTGPATVRVELARGWTDGHLYVEDARGALWQTEARAGEVLTIPDELVPPLRTQLVAEGPSGPQPVAERSLGAGVASVVADSDEPVRARLASLRRAERAGELRDNRLLSRVAEEHASRVCQDGRVSHLDEEGDPRERLARAGLRARHVGEVVARAEDPSRAYAAFLRSPSHRAALADRRFTDVGVGRSEDARGRTCLVVLLAAWPRPTPY